MAHGGKRPGAGRKPKGEGEKTRETAIKLLAEGTTPLDYMVGVMRGTEAFDETRFEAAKAAAPYMHARLASVAHSGEIGLGVERLNAGDRERIRVAVERELARRAGGIGSGGPAGSDPRVLN